jgi:hypothetical protein
MLYIISIRDKTRKYKNPAGEHRASTRMDFQLLGIWFVKY